MSSSTSNTEAYKFPKLNGENYAIWHQHMKATLQARYLWLIVSGVEAAPPMPADVAPSDTTKLAKWKAKQKEYLEWSLRDQAAQGLMKGAAEPSQWPHVADSKTSQVMWDTWKKLYVTSQKKLNVHYYFEELYTTKYVDSASMSDHISLMLDLKLKIEAAGEKVDDVHVACALCLSLPHTQSWELIKIQLFNTDPLTSELVATMLQAQFNCTAKEKKSEMALLAQKKQWQSKSTSGASGSKKKSGTRGPKTDDECHYCHAKGHWSNKCPKREEDEKKKNGSEKLNLAVNNLQDLGTCEVGRLYVAGSPGKWELILDCGATSHMFADRSRFTSYVSASGETISVGDGRSVAVAGRGTVSFKSLISGGY